jgi:hypothetical protein
MRLIKKASLYIPRWLILTTHLTQLLNGSS